MMDRRVTWAWCELRAVVFQSRTYPRQITSCSGLRVQG